MENAIAQKISRLRENIHQSALKTRRRGDDIRLVLVSKTGPAESILEAKEAGVLDFGENRAQELVAKKKLLPPGIRWHMIGHLQTNKVKQILGEVVLIHSVDRLELIREIERQAESKSIPRVEGLIQVNSSGEKTKSGFAPDEVEGIIPSIKNDSRLQIRGLMTIGPLGGDEPAIRKSFRTVKQLQEKLKRIFPGKDWGILSMGMSGDYQIAIEEGSNLVRIGTAIFGKR